MDEYDEQALARVINDAGRLCNAASEQIDDMDEDVADSPSATAERVGRLGADLVVLKADAEMALETWEAEPDALLSSGEPARDQLAELAAVLAGCDDSVASRIERSLLTHG